MSMKEFEEKVLSQPGAHKRVAEIEDELRLAAGLTAVFESKLASLAGRGQAHRRFTASRCGNRALTQRDNRGARSVRQCRRRDP